LRRHALLRMAAPVTASPDLQFHANQPIAFAMTNAAVAANPPTMTVCHALRNGRAVVNRPLMYPKTKRANRVTITDPIKAVWTEWKKKYGASGTIPPAM